jgi:MFS transporter, OPA family, sugar phosphate sensor protein UhpC
LNLPFTLKLDRRQQVFLITWLGYAGFYFCRKNFSVAMPLMSHQLGTDNMHLANLITLYSIMYMVGQFVSGFLNDRFGAKVVVGYGLILSVAANFLLGMLPSFAFMMGCMLLNGAGQSTGWSGMIRIMSNWYGKKERGVVMGWWTTCYVVGGFLAVLFATWWGTNHLFPELGWRKVFWAPAILLSVITIIFWRNIRNKPLHQSVNRENGLLSIEGAEGHSIKNMKALLEVLLNPALWLVGGMYFFTKFIRYSFLFWLPLYFTQNFHYSDNVAGYTSSVFELAGFFGILAAGYLSDKLFASGRFSVSAVFLFLLGSLFLVQPWIAHFGYWGNVVSVGLAGFLIYGPDSLMSAAAAMDIGKGQHTGVAAGFINGVGSAGQLLSPYAVAYISQKYGWSSLFQVFLVMALIAGVLLAVKWNYGTIKTLKVNESYAN